MWHKNVASEPERINGILRINEEKHFTLGSTKKCFSFFNNLFFVLPFASLLYYDKTLIFHNSFVLTSHVTYM